MSAARTGPSRRTPSQRDAINARAAAWERPLTPVQQSALCRLWNGRFARTRAGWSNDAGVRYYPTQTIMALVVRGLARIHARRFAIITPKGRRKLRVLRLRP